MHLVVVCVLTLKELWIKLSSVNYLYFKPIRVLSIIKVNAVRWIYLEFPSLLLVCVYTCKFHCSLPLFIPKDVCSNQINVNPNARPLKIFVTISLGLTSESLVKQFTDNKHVANGNSKFSNSLKEMEE